MRESKSLSTRSRKEQSINFRVGGTIEAFMQRVGPAPDGDMFLDANADNRESVVVEYEHAQGGTAVEAAGAGSSFSR